MHSEHLPEVYDSLSARQVLTLLKAIQSQTILLEHLLDEMIDPMTLHEETTIDVKTKG